MAAQIYAGLDGIGRQLQPPPATASPYGTQQGPQAQALQRIPASLPEGLQALADDSVLSAGLGSDFLDTYRSVKALEQDRFDAAPDKREFARREYLGRI